MKAQPKPPQVVEPIDHSKCTECGGPICINRLGGISIAMEPGIGPDGNKPSNLCPKCWRAGL